MNCTAPSNAIRDSFSPYMTKTNVFLANSVFKQQLLICEQYLLIYKQQLMQCTEVKHTTNKVMKIFYFNVVTRATAEHSFSTLHRKIHSYTAHLVLN